MTKTGPKPRSRAEIIARLKSNTRQDGECLVYLGHKLPSGYGVTSQGYKKLYAHRLIYEEAHGPIEFGLVVRHTCDNPSCLRLNHLVKGTHADNVNDKVAKQRHSFGEQHYLSKLTREQADTIRISPLNSNELSRIYNVSRASIQQVKKGKTWK